MLNSAFDEWAGGDSDDSYPEALRDHIKRHYYVTHRKINPSGLVPRGPAIDYSVPHGRAETDAGNSTLHSK